MADTISATYHLGIALKHVPELTHTLASNPTINTTVGSATGASLTATTTPAVTKVYYETLTMSGGADTIDMAVLDAGDLPNVSLVDLKPQLMYFEAGADNNAGGIKIEPSAAEGFPVFGAAGSEITLLPGEKILLFSNDKQAEITDDTDDKIDVTGTALDTLTVCIVAG
jgi:hypothetical protein